MAKKVGFRPLNVVLRPHSPAASAYAAVAHPVAARPVAPAAGETEAPQALAGAGGFRPRPDLDLTFHGGRTIADLVFVNRYLGSAGDWKATDRTNIDAALSALMSDPTLQKIIGQYYTGSISSTMLASDVAGPHPGKSFFKDDAESMVTQLFNDGVLGGSHPAESVICLLLPPGVVLVDGNSDGSAATEVHARPVLVDDDQVDSRHGLGGYHGSVHVGETTVYYAVSVYSQGNNGIVAFDQPWKNVVATLYHELCEARTDPDVEDVIRTGEESKLGFYSDRGGEIGDIPITVAGANLSLVMKEHLLDDGRTAPMQLQWSNHVHEPADSWAAVDSH